LAWGSGRAFLAPSAGGWLDAGLPMLSKKLHGVPGEVVKLFGVACESLWDVVRASFFLGADFLLFFVIFCVCRKPKKEWKGV